MTEAELEAEFLALTNNPEVMAELRAIWGSLAARDAALALEDSNFDDEP